jgi:hypothetical protein
VPSLRAARTGTVIITVERNTEIKVSLDAAKLATLGGASLGLPELQVGVNWHANRASAFGLSRSEASPPGELIQWVRLLGLSKDDVPRVTGAYGFEGRGEELPDGAPVVTTVDELLAGLPDDD